MCFPDSDMPRFAEEIQNVTVSKGRDALLACIVDNLRNYQVRRNLIVAGVAQTIGPSHNEICQSLR